MSRKKKIMIIVAVIVIILLIQNVFIGYRFGWGLFKRLGEVRLANLPGNAKEYDSSNVSKLDGNVLEGKMVLFLGSSVTYGASSLQDGIPEYFQKRLGCEIRKEAVSGTTLADLAESSYVSRLEDNVEISPKYDLVVVQLSTNDATKKVDLGIISDDKNINSFDVKTVTGAIEYIIAYSTEKWNCPVVFYTNARYDSEEYDAMVLRLKEVQEKWGIVILDLWSDDSFNRITNEERSLYMYDTIHPTKAGYMKWWCPEMEKQLLENIR